MKKVLSVVSFALVSLSFGLAQGADVVPDVIMMPGTQPQEVSMESPGRCLNCHKNYETNPRVEPGFGWMGSAMGNAGRDPIFWATLAIAEQDFDGAGDLCIRCHSAGGWVAGRSTPTDGSGLQASDDNGIDCDTCHQMTDPDMQVVDPFSGASIIGTMADPFINNSADSLVYVAGLEAYYGSGMYALSNDYGKLGPYNEGDAVARHQFTGSDFHRDVDFCGTCHDVSNSAVGQLAPNAGTQNLNSAPNVARSAELGYPLGLLIDPNYPSQDPTILDGMAAFNNPPYAFGIVERTFSEFKASPFGTDEKDANGNLVRIKVDDFNTLPADLRDPRGSLYAAYMASTTQDTRSGDYIPDPNGLDADTRYFSCQTCHMRAITGRGCDKNDAPNRLDQPMHDQTGGNYWVFPLIKYQDAMGTLRLGGGLSTEQTDAMDDGTLRAGQHLTQAATLDVNGDTVRLTNTTGHKLISGYPEGRRMWLNIKFYDNQDNLIEEIGEWGNLCLDANNNVVSCTVTGATPVLVTNPVNDTTFTPKSIVDIDNPKLKVYEVHPAMTQDWAATLRSIGYPADMPLSFDRITGDVDCTLAQLAGDPGTTPCDEGAHPEYHETFHFVLNNYVPFDNRIPPYQMSYDEAQKRNALPVPADQYGGSPGGVYEHWYEYDMKALAGNNGAVRADLTLYYQGTSWEYVQFLNNAVDTTDDGLGAPNPVTTFLADEGKNYLDAWVNTDETYGALGPMVPPYPMATATWHGVGSVAEICDDGIDNDSDLLIDCDDPDCDGDPACPTLIEWPMCFDGLDNDDDGLIDCADRTDCDDYTEETTCGLGVCASTGSKACRNGVFEEVICTPGDPTEPGTELTCDDGADNDCDGLVDMEDPDCMTCDQYPDRGSCNNDANCEWVGSPKNGSCQDAIVCTPTSPDEVGLCADGIDNDCDGVTDCADTADCGADPVCQVDCGSFNNRTDCRNAGCSWDNKNSLCQ